MKSCLSLLLVFVSLYSFAQKTDSLPKPKSTEPVYRVVQVMPEFPGGKDSLNAFIKANLKYPRAARENSMQGTVVLEYIVDTDGSLTDLKVKASVYSKLDDEALRIARLMPKFSPGKQAGKPVKVISTLPIVFKLPQ